MSLSSSFQRAKGDKSCERDTPYHSREKTKHSVGHNIFVCILFSPVLNFLCILFLANPKKVVDKPIFLALADYFFLGVSHDSNVFIF